MRFLLSAALLATVATAGAQPPPPPPPTDPSKGPITQDTGRPVGNNQDSRTAGPEGPVLLDNFHLIEKLARFDRERIPERVVHARGAGAHGEFVCTADMSQVTKAKVFAAGAKTPVFVRFSIVIPSRGGAEQDRDPRGFPVKFYTEEGNWDLVGNNLPVFFIRDAMKFPDLIHSLKPNPVTNQDNQQDPGRALDFLSLTPESTHMMTFVWSDRGTPANYRQMEGFGVNALKFVNAAGQVKYVKFNWRTHQGIKNNTAAEAKAQAGQNPAGFTADLYGHIAAGKFPAWDLHVQLLTPAELGKFDFDPLDDTKVWTGVPETKVGTMTLNKVPDNFFQFTEQVAFDPGVLVPGIELSEDKMVQGRAFSYADTQRYRIGTNYQSLPVNRPRVQVTNVNQDGRLNAGHTKGEVNYEPSETTGGRRGREDVAKETSKTAPVGPVVQKPTPKPSNFKQAGEQYRAFTPEERTHLVQNLADDMNKVKSATVKKRLVSHFYQADPEYGTRVAKATGVDMAEVEAMIKAEK